MKRLPKRRWMHFRELFHLVCFLAVILISTACVTVEKHQLPPGSEITKQAAWEVHQANIQSLKTWKLKGRLAGKSNNQGFRAGVQWNQLQNNYVIDLHGPLGRKVAVISGKQGNVQLKTSKGESFEADNAENLMQDLFGYSLPVNGLRHWLLGLPDLNQPHRSLLLDEHGRLMQLEQAGWLIDYSRYHESTPVLPALIKISNPTLNATIKVDRWTLGANDN
ncbi:MAG: lipoprotein insertase outer membrane protein LolB [Gammaproteobacteria bacterium]